MIYFVDWFLFAYRYSSSVLRESFWASILRCMLLPLKYLSTEFHSFRRIINQELTFNSQRLIFEFLLNQRFNNGLAGIYIRNRQVQINGNYIYGLSEGEETLVIRSEEEYLMLTDVQPIYLRSEIEQGADSDITVFVPIQTLNIEQEKDRTNELHAVVQKYIFAGVRYTIKNY